MMEQGGYFRWPADVRPAYGRHRASILDFRSGDVYSLNGAAAAVLRALEAGRPRDQLDEAERSFAARLVALGLGEWAGTPQSPEPPPADAAGHALEFLWLELRSDCSAACAQCYSQSQNPRLSSRAAPVEGAPPLTVVEWKEVLRAAADAGCRAVQFIGGEVLLARDLLALVDCARALDYEYIEVFTNAFALGERTAAALAERGVRVAVSLHGAAAETHDAVAGLPGSFNRVLTALDHLRRHDVPFRVAGVAVRRNQDDILRLPVLAGSLGAVETRLDVVRPIGSGADPALLPDRPEVLGVAWLTRPAFTADRRRYERNRSWNPCWAGKLTVTTTGDVLPCVMGRDLPVGNVRRTPLWDILDGPRLGDLWGLTKDEMAVCRDCEYRYVCGDCRPLAAAQGNLRGAMPRCTYDPCSGEWGAGPGFPPAATEAPPEAALPLFARLPRSPRDAPVGYAARGAHDAVGRLPNCFGCTPDR